VQTYTVRNLALHLFNGRPDVSGQLIRLGCLFSEAARAGFIGDQFAGTGLPPTDDSAPVPAKADRGAYGAIVNLENFFTTFGLDVACTRAVAAQAVHVAERGNHHLVHSTLTAVKNDCQKHAVSATHGGKKTNLVTYAGFSRRFCAKRAETATTGGGLMHLNRHVVVSWLEVEARRHLVSKAPRRRGRCGATASARARGAAVADAEGPNHSAATVRTISPTRTTWTWTRGRRESGPARRSRMFLQAKQRQRGVELRQRRGGGAVTWPPGGAEASKRQRGGAAAGRPRRGREDAAGRQRGAASGADAQRDGGGKAGTLWGGDHVDGPRRGVVGAAGPVGRPRNLSAVARLPMRTLHQTLRHQHVSQRVLVKGRWTGRRPMERLRAAGVHWRAPRLF